MHGPCSGRGLPRALVTILSLVSLVALGACGTRGDNTVGVAFITELAEKKAVTLIEVAPPDAGVDFALGEQPETVGSSTTLLLSARDGYLGRALARFDSSGIAAIADSVDSAFVTLFYGSTFGDGPLSMTVHRVTSSWAEGRIHPDLFPTFLSAADTVDIPFGEDVTDTLSFRLDDLVRFWVDQPDSNFGLALVPLDGETDEVEFSSRESIAPPRLTIHVGEGVASPLPTQDTFVLSTTPAFQPLEGFPERLTVARGLPVRSLLEFNWPDLGDRATVNRAEVVFWLDDASSSLNAFEAGIQQVTGEWQADSTEVDTVVWGVSTFSSDADSVVFEITGLIHRLMTEENRGFLLHATDERPDTDYVRMHGPDTMDADRAPRLRIWYTPGPEEGDRP